MFWIEMTDGLPAPAFILLGLKISVCLCGVPEFNNHLVHLQTKIHLYEKLSRKFVH